MIEVSIELILIIIGTVTSVFVAIVVSYQFFIKKPKLRFSTHEIFAVSNKKPEPKNIQLIVKNVGKSPVENFGLEMCFSGRSNLKLDLADRNFFDIMPSKPTIKSKQNIPIISSGESVVIDLIFVRMSRYGLMVYIQIFQDSNVSSNWQFQEGENTRIEILPVGKGINIKKPLRFDVDLTSKDAKITMLN